MTIAIHLGFEIGTGTPIAVPLRHMAVTGQTQQSGKTTTLEALIERSGGTALTFVTKRGEGSFANGRRIQPYFRDRADWQFVTSILDATLQEKNKFLRPWIIKICRTTKTLADVQARVQEALETAKGINEGVYTQLNAYLELIVPEIERAELADTLDLQPGLNVMDVSSFATPMQMLFIQSALDWVNACCTHTTVVIPEAWEFLPQSKGSPVKASAETLIRKGAGLGNHIWLDSQDMAGVDNLALRACTVWLIGVQREINEVKRALANIPANLKRPSAAEVATLERGQFFACFGTTVAKVYVQPAWMADDQARQIARGELSVERCTRPAPAPPPPPAAIPEPHQEPEEEPMSAAVEKKLDDVAGKMDSLVDLLKQFIRSGAAAQRAVDAAVATPPALGGTGGVPMGAGGEAFDEEALYQRFKRRLLADAPGIIKVITTLPEIEIAINREKVETNTEGAKGMLAFLLADGFFKDTTSANAAWKELQRRWNYKGASARVYEQMDWFTSAGFVTKEADGFKAVDGIKSRITKV